MIERLLVIDDDAALCRSIQIQLQGKGLEVEVAHTASEGLSLLRDGDRFDLVLLDVNLPDADGLSALKKIGEIKASPPVVIITARQDMGATIGAMKSGAFDYIRKPFDIDDVLLVIEKASRHQSYKPSSSGGHVLPPEEAGPREIIGAHPAMLEILKQIGLLSRSRVNVLIRGESGTGKELVARAIHDASSPKKPFVAVNCSAVVPTLLESELFGHAKGAFTGADREKPGKLELAGEGTVFFDEIGDMALDLQAKLLRVLQEKEFERVGGLKPLSFGARVVCATHRDLQMMIREGKFREDLLYRLAVAEITLPALRERRSDIPVLAHHFIAKIARQFNKRVDGIDEAAMRRLNAYDWPGNVRELENVLTRAIAITRTTILGTEDIEFPMSQHPSSTDPAEVVPLSVAEKRHIEKALAVAGWNITKTARMLEISPTTLRKKIADYDLEQA
jgi:two-component system response regulator AtoC